jgi:hypothetical protein
MTFLDSEPSDTGRTRIKLCGMTRERDIDYAVTLDTDAIGLIFYPPSPRNLPIEQATRLAARVPPSIAKVGLFVNASRERINEVLDAVPLDFLQLHGDESPEDCSGYQGRANEAGTRFARILRRPSRGARASARFAYRGIRRFRKGFRLVARPTRTHRHHQSPRRRASGRFEWWLERSKRR